MSDENTNPDAGEPMKRWGPETDPDGYTLDDIRLKDWYLDTVLSFAHGLDDENSDGALPLTVTSNGVVVSGFAISRSAWMVGVADQYKQAGAAEIATYVEKMFKEAHDDVVAQAKGRVEANLPSIPRRFLHMKDAQFVVGGTHTQVPLWRGALADITGWSLGSWNSKQDLGDE